MTLKEVPQRRRSLWRNITASRMLLLMCIPAIAFFLVFNYAPMPGIWIAFTNFNYRDGIFGSPFVGFRNFEFLIKSGQLWLLTRNTILYNLAFIVLGNVLAITFAIMLNEIRLKYFKKITQSIMFLPYFISVVLVGVIAFNLLNYDTGALNALIEQVRIQLDAARRLRLARDRWHERSSSFRAYQKSVAPIVASMTKAQRSLDDIKRLAGSDAIALVGLAGRLASHSKALNVVAVPDELKAAHALLVSAVNLAETAVKTRRQATVSGELQLAWDASSAAAGSMMLLSRAQEDMEAAVRLPEIR